MRNDDLNYRLLRAITRAQSGFIIGQNTGDLFDRLLDSLLDLTDSAYGFIGEVMRDPDGAPYLKTHAITNIAWNAETRKFYEENAPRGLEFRNLKTLFGAVLTGGQPVISNDPASDPRAGGIPEGHPPLRAFLGIPFYSADTFVGMVGIANRPDGYSKALMVFLKPLLDTCANIIDAYRLDQRRIRAESDLKGSEGRIRAILDGAHDAIIAADPRGIIQSFNPAAERIFGYPAEAVIGENVRMLMPEPFRSRHDGYIADYLATGVKKIIGIGREALAMRADGEVFPIDLAITEATSDERRRFVGLIRDITQRKEAQKQLDDTMTALEKSRDNLTAILNQARMGSVMIGGDGRVTYISRHCQPILGRPPETLTGEFWKDICPFNPAAKAALAEAFAAPVDRRRKVAATVSGPDDEEGHLEIEVHDDPRDPIGKILFLYDVTEVHALRRQLADQSRFDDIIGKSDAIRRVFAQIRDLADVNATVLIEGETGTGKELVARALHNHSRRKNGPFIAVNCGGLTESLVASQLFGHRRGAFTGAAEDRIGVFEAASGGVLFLDEIGEIPWTVQPQLLRVLQEREITRVGETTPRGIDVRLVAATNRDLRKEVAAGRFREDLLFRVRVAVINLPPLRQRIPDIPLLAGAFLRRIGMAAGKPVESISPEAMRTLLDHPWPGNVRELQNIIESAVIRSRGTVIEPDDLPPDLSTSPSPAAPLPSIAETTPDPIDKDGYQKERLLDALRSAHGNRAEAARLLGIGRTTLYRQMKKFGLDA